MAPDVGDSKKACVQGMQVMCYSKTWDCNAFIQMVEKNLSGVDATVELEMLKPGVFEEGQDFTIKDNDDTIVIGEYKCRFI